MAIVQIVDIVASLVSKLTHTFVITSNVNNGGGNHQLFTKNTYYLSLSKEIVIGGLNYIVTSLDFNKSITVAPVGHQSAIGVTSFELDAPMFFHGTIKSAEREILATSERQPGTYPIVYLFEEVEETFNNDKLEYVRRNTPIEVFFLDLYYPNNRGLNPNLLEDILKPQSNVTEKFIEVVEKEKGIGKLTGTRTRTNIPRFAITTRSGESEKIFNENLSGVRIKITLPIVNSC